MGPRQHFRVALVTYSSQLLLKASWFQGQTVIEIHMTVHLLRPFDLQALILKRFFSVVPQMYQKKNQRSFRSSDVTVNPKITPELSVSAYSEIAR